MDQNNYIFEVEDLCKYFPAGKKKVVKAVDGINLKIRKGETIGLVGESGCGKTTCGRTIIKLYEPTKGKILFEGKDVSKLHGKELLSFKKDVQVIFQDPYASLDPRMTIGEIISEGMHVHLKLSQKEMDERVADLLNKVGLNAEYANRFAHELSGGQRQRVAMGRAIVRNPKVFLMDEPLSNLDAKLRVQMRVEISKLHQRLGTTIIYVTHDQTEAMTLGTRIVVMKDGVIQQVDTPQNLYEKPQNLFVAGFMGSPQMNFLDAVVEANGNNASLKVAGKSIPLPPAKSKKLIDGGYVGKTVTFGIRPEDIYDQQMFIETSKCVFESTVRVYELLGAEVFLYFDLAEFPITARVDPRTTSRPGDTVKFAFDVEKIHVFDKETEQIITN